MKTSTMMWIGGGIAVWYFFLRNKGPATGQATGAATQRPADDPATSGVAPQIDEPDIEYYGPIVAWQPGWGSGFRPNWGQGGGRRYHHHRGGGGGGHRGRR